MGRTASKTRHISAAGTGVQSLPAGTRVGAHFHDQHQLVYAGRGVLAVTTDVGLWTAPPTRAIWVPAGTVHEHRAYGSTDLYTIGLPVGTNPLRLRTPAVLQVGRLLRELMVSYADMGAADAETPPRRRMRAVLLDQLRASSERPLHVPMPEDTRLAEIGTLVTEDPAGHVSLQQMAGRVAVSPRTLSRLCRDELGMTFPQWRTQLRLHTALRLLAEDLPVSVVAHRCGWSTTSAFVDVFRRTLGYTPGGRRTRRDVAPERSAARSPDGQPSAASGRTRRAGFPGVGAGSPRSAPVG